MTSIARALVLVLAIGAAAGCRTVVHHPGSGVGGSSGSSGGGAGGSGAAGEGGLRDAAVVDGESERPLGSDAGAEALDALAADGGGMVVPVPRRRLSAGGQLACALGSDGAPWCWGFGGAAIEQATTDSAAPVMVSRAGTAAIDIAASNYQVCVLKSDGSIFCAGYLAEDAILGGIGGKATALCAGSAGLGFGCALRADGAVFCWSGTGTDSPLGGSTSSWAPMRVPELDGAVDIACGGPVACALRNDGSLWCLGGGSGNVTSTNGMSQETPRMVPELGTGVTAVFAGDGGFCASKSDGSMLCWGPAFGLVVGPGTPFGQPSFHAEPRLSGARRIAIGDAHACAIQSDGSLVCFGANDYGQLGDGTFVAHAAPAPVVGLDAAVTEVVAGTQMTCALLANGGIRCFGNNDHGTLGDGSALSVRAAAVDLGGSAVLSHHAHHEGLGSAVLTDGTVRIWGLGASRLMTGAPLRAARPIALTTPATAPLARKATVSGSGTCLLTSDGAVSCLRSMFAPGDMLPLGVLSNFSTGTTDLIGACAVRGDGFGACNLPTGLTTSSVPASDQGMFQKLAIGWFDGGCDLSRDGRIDCWANDLAVVSQPVSELGGAAIDLSVFDQACAVRSDGAVLCWGLNDYPLPVAPELVVLPAPCVGVTVGLNYACAWTADGQLFCWGHNEYGQLGDGTLAMRDAPVLATVAPGPIRVASAGRQVTCVELAADGSLWCWGWNGAGELGDGKGGPRAVPVPVAVP